MTVFVVNTLTSELGNYVFRRLGIDPLQIGREGLRVMDTNLVEETFDDLVRVLQYGLASRER